MNAAPHWSATVLTTVGPVVERARHVTISRAAIASVADWMAYEEFTFPRNLSSAPKELAADADAAIDLTTLVGCLNFAFSDFETGEKFIVERDGVQLVDTDGMSACIHEALARGTPLLEGGFLAEVSHAELDELFAGSITLLMVEQRVAILNAVGRTLVAGYGGRFHRFVRDCAPAMYADGEGLLERLVHEFPRFADVSTYHGHEVELHKLGQLALWSLHSAGLVELRDLARMSAFADYIVPVALRVMGILSYDDELENTIMTGGIVERDSDQEIEIRATSLFATALLTDAINERRPADLRLVVPQVDFRLWKSYHATFWPHHLTPTIMY